LVIEVDGYSHFLDEVILKDKIKEKALKEAGYEPLYDLQIPRY
jgi:very-short-patch-repair endonuclease